MNIDPSNNPHSVYFQNLTASAQRPAAPANPASGAPATSSGDTLELKALDSLRAIPEVRPEVVAKGKELLSDPNFPSKEMINEIAKLIEPFADDQ